MSLGGFAVDGPAVKIDRHGLPRGPRHDEAFERFRARARLPLEATQSNPRVADVEEIA
jgi:hypothetical protein